jgi:hypothetical protein
MRIGARFIQIELEYGRIREQSIRNAKRFIWNFLRFIGGFVVFRRQNLPLLGKQL